MFQLNQIFPPFNHSHRKIDSFNVKKTDTVSDDKSLLQQCIRVNSLKCFFKREQELSVDTEKCYPQIPPFLLKSLISSEDSQEIAHNFYLSVDQLATSNQVEKMSYLFILFEQILNNSTNVVALVRYALDSADNPLNCLTSLIAAVNVYRSNTACVSKKSKALSLLVKVQQKEKSLYSSILEIKLQF